MIKLAATICLLCNVVGIQGESIFILDFIIIITCKAFDSSALNLHCSQTALIIYEMKYQMEQYKNMLLVLKRALSGMRY